VIVPRLNKRDLAEVPATITDGLTFHFVEHMDEVLKLALLDPDVRQPDVTPQGEPTEIASEQPQPATV
jgi:ATP-dependent Lon protease